MISIITPTYKRHKYLKNAIDSVLAQTFTDFEFIIVDDNALDPVERRLTKDLVQGYSDSRIRYIQNKANMGGAASRNVGIFEAKGVFITFLDDDDMYLPDKLEVQVKAMIENGWDVSVMDGATYNYETGEKVAERHQQIRNGITKDELIRAHLLYHISGTNTFMYKASFLKEIGGFVDVPSCQEYMLMQKTLDNNPRFGYIPEIHIKNFMHPGEQLSTGPKKLKGQQFLYESKKQHFDLLTPSEQRQVTCRHHGVLFFVYYKMHNYGKAFVEAEKCFFSSPKHAFRWFKEYRKKISA